MFTSKVRMDDSRLLQESYLAARQSKGATSRHTGNYEWWTCPRSLRGG